MRRILAVAGALFVVGCSSTTNDGPASFGTVTGIPLVPADQFFVATTQNNGDYSLTLVIADRAGYCPILQQNLAGFPKDMVYALFVFSTPVGTGQVDPGPGTYPIAALNNTNSTAQSTFGTYANCVPGFGGLTPAPVGTSGNVVMTTLAGDLSSMSGTVNVVYGTSGTLAGTFNAPLCDIPNPVQGASQCYQ
jgi:hypothetical protein